MAEASSPGATGIVIIPPALHISPVGTADLSVALPLAAGQDEGTGPSFSWWQAATYLGGSAVVAAAGAAFSPGPLVQSLAVVAYLAALPWLFVASTETLLVLAVLALPFDTWKVGSVLSAPNLLIALAGARLFLEAARGGRRLRPSFAYRPLIAIVIVATAATVLSDHFGRSVRILVSVIGAGTFAVLLLNYAATLRSRERILDAVFLSGILVGVTTIAQVAAFQVGVELWDVSGGLNLIYNLGTSQLRATGLFNAPSALATYALPAVACGLFLWSYPTSVARRRLWRAGTGLGLIAALLSLTRATLLTIALLVAALVVVRTWGRLRARRRWLLVTLAAFALAAAWAAPRLYTFLAAMNPLSTYSRLSIYIGALNSFLAHPVIGTGLDTYISQDFSWAPLYDIAVSSGSRDLNAAFDPRLTHSTPLQILVDMGIVGLVAYGWMLLATLRRATRAARAAGGRSIAAAVLSASLSTLFVLFFNSGLAMKPLWMTLGLLWALAL